MSSREIVGEAKVCGAYASSADVPERDERPRRRPTSLSYALNHHEANVSLSFTHPNPAFATIVLGTVTTNVNRNLPIQVSNRT